jgi:hypothetical protein
MKTQTLLLLFLFGIAMAFLESAVVIYLRELYYPEGFTVAMKLISDRVITIEILREVATIIMLIGIAAVAGKTFVQRFAWFLFCFAVWDIFYYIWLKALINWPGSFMTWDILFLIPVAWLGPVLAPVLCSLTMITLSFTLLKVQDQKPGFKIQSVDWTIFITGSILILFTFIQDYGGIIVSNGWLGEIHALTKNEAFITMASQYIPQSFNWMLFMAGELILAGGILLIWARDYEFKTTIYKGI